MSVAVPNDKSKDPIESSIGTNKSSQQFKFVNNSPGSMRRPKMRMKPAFKIIKQQSSQDSIQQSSQLNKDSMIIEHVLDPMTSNFINTSDKKFSVQMSIKRPPGRPRKHPIEENKVKRPQGRPRKYPVQVSGSSIPKAVKKDEPKVQQYPIDTELLPKRGRGRPKKDSGELSDATSVAVAAVAAENDSKL
jgi:hypothetical protein